MPGIGVRVDTTGLADGVYRGSLTIRTENPDIIADPAILPVELTVWTTAPPLTVSPASLEFFADMRNPTPSATVRIATGAIPVEFEVSVTGDNQWFLLGVSRPTPLTPALTPADLVVQAQGDGLLPGAYSATIRITAVGNSVDIPIKLEKTGIDLRPFGTPTVSAIVSAASQRPGVISPGAIITLYGFPLAAAPAKSFEIASGKIATVLNGTRVLFDRVPAPILYVSPAQINVIVPYEVAGKEYSVVEVEAPPLSGVAPVTFGRSPPQAVPVAAATPALFTLSSAGAGQVAALNQDNTFNGPQAPAAVGSILQLFATGEGMLLPAPETGAFAGDTTARPLLPVTVTIGGVPATVQYAGPSPGSVFGVLQVNVAVPPVGQGAAVPVVLTVGDSRSPDGATVAIR